jgi:hypothetical protein
MNHIAEKEMDDHENQYFYEWKDMIGVSGVTYPNGLKNIYNYDDKNRLETVKDENGSLIKQLLYHIVNE